MKRKAATLCILAYIAADDIQFKKRTLWTKDYIKRKRLQGLGDNLMKELALEDTHSYRRWLRMSEDQFMELLDGIKDDITTSDTMFRNSLTSYDKLAVTLRFLATGKCLSR
jgi:hypothetical protein